MTVFCVEANSFLLLMQFFGDEATMHSAKRDGIEVQYESTGQGAAGR